jgi:NAD(P)-dependent dehydrogenase (short-subunit alcohol dehydrogenase family)
MTAASTRLLIAGATGGVGRALALSAAREGAVLLLLGRDAGSLDALRADVVDAGGTAYVAVADATSAEQVERAVAAFEREAGGIDVVVNTVGINLRRRRLEELDEAGWRAVLDGNLTSAFLLTRAVLPSFRAHGGGLLIHISSVAASVADLSGAAYQASKAGLAALARATALETGSDGVRVTTISPGLIDTPFVRHRPKAPTREELAGALRPEDIADVCLAVIRLPARATVSEIVMRPTAA